MGGACGVHRREDKWAQYLVVKPGSKRPLGRPRHRWEHNLRMDIREIG